MHRRLPVPASLLAVALVAGGCTTSERGTERRGACNTEPLRRYAEQREGLEPQLRMKAASEAVLDACPWQLLKIQRQLVQSATLEAADQRATALAVLDDDSRLQFWRSVCPRSFIHRPDPKYGRERHLEQWEHCALARLSPFSFDELHDNNWMPVLWGVAERLEAGGVDPALARLVTRDLAAPLDPVEPTWAVSAVHRLPEARRFSELDEPRQGPQWLAIPGTATAAELEPMLDGRPTDEAVVFEAQVRSTHPSVGAAGIELLPLTPGGAGLDVWLGAQGLVVDGKGVTAEAVITRARAQTPAPSLRLHVEAERTWQQAVSTIDALFASCGGWRPYLEADPRRLGPGCPFARIELGVESPRWRRLRMVISKWREHAAKAAYPRKDIEPIIEDARSDIEGCMRESAALRRAESHEILLAFTTNTNGELAVMVLARGLDGPSSHVESCVAAALGVEPSEGLERHRPEHEVASVTLGVELPPG